MSIKAYIGIGGVKENLFQLQESYGEATKAIEVGKIYNTSNRIYMYSFLLLERFLYEVPLNLCERFSKILFAKEYKKVLSDEMIATIEKFFENSLNLSETARQLFIHRNTLVYRLDKIQRIMGLDLRNFHDAVTFKIMMMLMDRYTWEA
jgi:carbohydrate diacid regulator